MNNPQVAMSQPYGPSAEVYSFAIILWQLVSHQVPYAGVSSNAFHKRVVLEGARPPLGNKAWPAPLSQLFAECWSTPTERPAMEDVTPPPNPPPPQSGHAPSSPRPHPFPAPATGATPPRDTFASRVQVCRRLREMHDGLKP
jgi:hypothetical protein